MSIAVPYLGRTLALSTGGPLLKEIVQHAAPGAVILALYAAAIPRLARGKPSGDYFLMMAPAVGLAGLWMTATHIPLVTETLRGQTTIETVLLHATAGPAAILLAVILYHSPPRRLDNNPTSRHESTSPRRPPKLKHR